MCRLLSTTSYSVHTLLHRVKGHMCLITTVSSSHTRVVCAYGLHTATCRRYPRRSMVVPMSELSEYLNANLGDRVADDIVRAAKAKGHRIHRTVVYAYLRGDNPASPRPGTIEALAAGFGLDPRILRELSGRPAGELGPYVPVDASSSLTRQQRKAIDDLIVAIVNDKVRGGTDGSTTKAHEKSPGGGGVTRHTNTPETPTNPTPQVRTATQDDFTLANRHASSRGQEEDAAYQRRLEADQTDPEGHEFGA